MAQATGNEVTLISHSDVVYWWPAWVVGYIMALVSFVQGNAVAVTPATIDFIHPSNNLGLLFIATLALLVIFTNAKLRGIYSVATIVAIVLVAVTLAWLGWWDDIVAVIPTISARANMGFYLLFSTIFLLVWLSAFFVFDRLTYWRVRPGQIVEQHLIGGGEQSFDTQGLAFERRDQDAFRHLVLGLGAGDLKLASGNGTHRETIDIPNVLLVDRKLKAIQQLISIKPDQVPPAVSSP